jgi:hypothetical protein
MKIKDISEFKVGEIATSITTGFRYEIKQFIFTVRKNKRQIESSSCTNLDTGEEGIVITWGKNKTFE